jgi:predicted SprT family Zn-dependent metalloprotease
MNHYQAAQLARQKMAEHGLHDWQFALNGRFKNILGQCCYGRKLIELGKDFVSANGQAEVLDTILHEIAHALTQGAGHGPVWKAMCLKIGARPQQYANPVEKKVVYKWQLAIVTKGEYSQHVERFHRFSHRKTDLSRKQLIGRPETLGKLQWVACR